MPNIGDEAKKYRLRTLIGKHFCYQEFVGPIQLCGLKMKELGATPPNITHMCF